MAKKTTTGHKNEKAEEMRLRKMSADFNRLSGDTISNLCSATHDAMKTLQGDGSASDAVCNSELYCELLTVSAMACNHYIHREKAKHEYAKMEMPDLLKELYVRMQMYHHYGACKSRDITGIVWSMEPTGVFVVRLQECAVNMECEMETEPGGERGTLFCVGLNVLLLEKDDPEEEGSRLYGKYGEFLTFCCEFKGIDTGEVECRDVVPPDTYFNEKALRTILAGFDMIGEMLRGKK